MPGSCVGQDGTDFTAPGSNDYEFAGTEHREMSGYEHGVGHAICVHDGIAREDDLVETQWPVPHHDAPIEAHDVDVWRELHEGSYAGGVQYEKFGLDPLGAVYVVACEDRAAKPQSRFSTFVEAPFGWRWIRLSCAVRALDLPRQVIDEAF